MGNRASRTISLHDGAVNDVLVGLLRISQLFQNILAYFVDPLGHHLLGVLLAQQKGLDALPDGRLQPVHLELEIVLSLL